MNLNDLKQDKIQKNLFRNMINLAVAVACIKLRP